MKRSTRLWLITASFLVLLGCALFACVMTALKWDFSKLSTVEYETNSYEIGEVFDNISIKTDTANITLALSEDGKCYVESHEEKKARHNVCVQNGTLTVEVSNTGHWYNYIEINFDSPKITVFLPESEYKSLLVNGKMGTLKIPAEFTFENADMFLSTGDVEALANVSENLLIKTSTGNIRAADISVGTAELSTTTGEVIVSGMVSEGDVTVKVTTGNARLTDIRCKKLVSSGSTGEILLNNAIAENFSLKRSAGNISLDKCDADELFIKTGTGNVNGTLLSSKVFTAKSSTGKIDVPNTATGGKCEIKTDTGDIEIKLN